MASVHGEVNLYDWFLTPDERGNLSTEIDRRRSAFASAKMWSSVANFAFSCDS